MGHRSSYRSKDQETFPEDLGTVQLPAEEVQREDYLDGRGKGGDWQRNRLVCPGCEQVELG